MYLYSNLQIKLYINIYIGTVGLEKHYQLSSIYSAVLQLIKTLLYQAYQFTLYCDNLFRYPKLFSLLRSLGIGIYGTAQCYVIKPVFGNIDDWKAAWGILHSVVVNCNVWVLRVLTGVDYQYVVRVTWGLAGIQEAQRR
jgi:hypothetical protein